MAPSQFSLVKLVDEGRLHNLWLVHSRRRRRRRGWHGAHVASRLRCARRRVLRAWFWGAAAVAVAIAIVVAPTVDAGAVLRMGGRSTAGGGGHRDLHGISRRGGRCLDSRGRNGDDASSGGW